MNEQASVVFHPSEYVSGISELRATVRMPKRPYTSPFIREVYGLFVISNTAYAAAPREVPTANGEMIFTVRVEFKSGSFDTIFRNAKLDVEHAVGQLNEILRLPEP